jgi:flagellar basal body P-ring protein FlgI
MCALVGLVGCGAWSPWSVRSQSPEPAPSDPPKTRLVGDLAVAHGTYWVTVEGIGLVTGLKGSGSDPKSSPERDLLVSEMQGRGVRNPNALLASNGTSLVTVRANLRPGLMRGDRFDVEVRVQSRSDTTSLRGGWLLETRLKEGKSVDPKQDGHFLYLIGNEVGLAQGSVLVDPAADPKNKDDRVRLCRGRVLGGGLALKSRPLGLKLKEAHKSVFNSARIEAAVNKRFTVMEKGIKTGVATAFTDGVLNLKVHPRYSDNIERYVHVVRSIPLHEDEAGRIERLALLEKQLLDPITTARAALQLEAIGRLSIDALKKGIQSPDPEVRFRAAESLAYLDDSSAAAPLAEAARNQPAFRVFALAALGAMNDLNAYDALREMLALPSVETRYGAFRALWTLNPNDPLVLGEKFGDFSYHVLNTSGPPLIHVTRSHRAEIVLFGTGHRFVAPLAVEAGNQILVTASRPGEVVVSKFVLNEPDQKRVVSDRVDDVIRAIVDIGGSYADVLQALEQAKVAGALPSRLEIDALPEAGRVYTRHPAEGDGNLATKQ